MKNILSLRVIGTAETNELAMSTYEESLTYQAIGFTPDEMFSPHQRASCLCFHTNRTWG